MTSRAESMQKHLIGQFQGKPVIRTILDAFASELDELNKCAEDLKNKRWIDTAEGVQLDGIGDIIGQGRQIDDAVQIPFFGFAETENGLSFGVGRFFDSWEMWLKSVNLADPEYRLLLKSKIYKNQTQCTAEETITSLKNIYNADLVLIEDRGNAKIGLAIGRILTQSEIRTAAAVNLLIRGAGIGCDYIEQFDGSGYFGFYGQANAKGFEVGKFADMISA